MMVAEPLTVYIDYKSPYAYLAIQPTLTLQRDFNVSLQWLPYTLDIPDFLGSAKVDENGVVIEQNRSPHQWRRVRYSYMDARRYANLCGLTIRGPRKIWDSSIAGIGLLYAQEQNVVGEYNLQVYERFWRRELNIEDQQAIKQILVGVGADVSKFDNYMMEEGRILLDRIQIDAEKQGVFGVPTYIFDKELFWGREHIALIRHKLAQKGLAKPGKDTSVDTTHAWRPGGPGW